jgi:PAS domain S-box-containing protein
MALQGHRWCHVIGILGIARDITARKRDRGAVATRARRPGIGRIRERTAELLAINQALERQIAARIQAEIALRDSEERFRQLTEHIREVFWVHGIEEERFLYVSPAYEEVWGRPIHGLHERPLDWIEAVHPDDRPRVQTAHLAKRKLGYFDEEYRIVRPDGTLRWIWDRGFPVHDESGLHLSHRRSGRGHHRPQAGRGPVAAAAGGAGPDVAAQPGGRAGLQPGPRTQPAAGGHRRLYTQACLALLRQANTDPRVLTGTLDEVASQGLRAGEIIRHLRELVRKHPAAQAALDLNALFHAR